MATTEKTFRRFEDVPIEFQHDKPEDIKQNKWDADFQKKLESFITYQKNIQAEVINWALRYLTYIEAFTKNDNSHWRAHYEGKIEFIKEFFHITDEDLTNAKKSLEKQNG